MDLYLLAELKTISLKVSYFFGCIVIIKEYIIYEKKSESESEMKKICL